MQTVAKIEVFNKEILHQRLFRTGLMRMADLSIDFVILSNFEDNKHCVTTETRPHWGGNHSEYVTRESYNSGN